MKVFITGSAGFIGSHVCEHFIARGYQVIGLDNFDNFYPRSIKENNLKFIRKSERFLFHEGDIRDRVLLNKIFDDNRFDLVIHLAAKAGVRPSIEKVEEYYDVNVNGTLNILEAMRTHNVRKLLFASSSSVYGNNTKLPFSESDPVDNPVSPYASTKKSGELLCHVYSHLYGFDITCLRFFTVYGPRQRPDLAVYKFTRLIDEGKTVDIYGDGTTSRDYTYIDDILNGIDRAADIREGFHVYNLGESESVELLSLVKMIEEALGKKAVLNYLPMQPGDVKNTYADISKARNELGYDPGYDFRKGLGKFIEWYRENKGVFTA
ncbi:MAG: NAD-dependent epimerase/dehydratase family protein [Bacteroidales bacterium]|nr:NAD-dependent epimerase/dehydratase family protein [Bacteroidales bacterium]